MNKTLARHVALGAAAVLVAGGAVYFVLRQAPAVNVIGASGQVRGAEVTLSARLPGIAEVVAVRERVVRPAFELPMKKSTRHAVTVTVIPGDITPGAETWEFLVAFQSHLASHLETLPNAAVLVGPQGSERATIEWASVAPGSFNRQGTFRFRSIAPMPNAIELRIKLFGEHVPRVFRWKVDRGVGGAAIEPPRLPA